MKKSKKRVPVILCFVFFLGMIGLLVSMYSADKQTDKTVTVYSTTVSDVGIIDHEKSFSVYIFSKEFPPLYIAITPDQTACLEDVRALQPGQTIVFSVENYRNEKVNQALFVPIVSLKTEQKDILTLENYNEMTHRTFIPMRISGVVAATVFLLLAVFFFVKGRKEYCVKVPEKETGEF